MKDKSRYLILFSFILLLIAYHLIGYAGHYGYDDIHYARLAYDFNNGTVDYNDHFSYRIVVILFTALSYSVFGISDFASSLPAIIVSLLILTIVFFVMKNENKRTIIIALSLTTLSDWFLFYSDKLMPDIYVALFITAGISVIWYYKFSAGSKNALSCSVLLVLSLLLGFLAKETIVFIIPLLAYLFITDIIFRRDIRFWIYTLIGGCVVLLLYFLVTWLITGDFLKRFEAISGNGYLNLCSYDKQPTAFLIRRITRDFFEMLVYQTMMTGFIVVIAYLFRKRSKEVFKFNDSLSFWITSALILLLSSNFMPTSLTAYSPLCPDPRHYLFLIPVSSIPASIILNEFIEKKRFKIQLVVILALVTLLSFFITGNSFRQLYLPLTILFSAYIFVAPKPVNRNIFSVLFFIVLLIIPLSMINYSRKVNYRKQKEILVSQVINQNKDCVVITDEVQKRLGEYYSRFDKNNNVEFLDFREFKNDTADKRKKLLLLNWYTQYLSKTENEDLPYYARHISSDNKLIFQDRQLNIYIYEMEHVLLPEQTGATLLYTFNDFENKVTYWAQDDSDITDEIFHEGNRSNRVREFSSTFEYPVDSLKSDNASQIIISCSLYCHLSERSEAKLVVSAEDASEAYFWQAQPIDRYVKAYGNWWLVKYEIAIEIKALKKNSKLKVYLWNINKRNIYIDDFEIKITGL
jgi:4-amino-4-deoxy-L-arabinose transferase-like glycosyltransferase